MIIELFIAVIGSGALSALISGIFSLINEKKHKQSGLYAGVRELLYDRIKTNAKCYIKKGYISTEELEDLIGMHNIYHDELYGNGYLDELMNKVKSLPIK